MKNDLPLTEKEVEIYRHLYYDCYKVLSKKEGVEPEDLESLMAPHLESMGWSWNQFLDYKSIDLMQRLVVDYSHEMVLSGHRSEPMTSKEEYRAYDPNFGALRLKDNDRSDDPDKHH